MDNDFKVVEMGDEDIVPYHCHICNGAYERVIMNRATFHNICIDCINHAIEAAFRYPEKD